MSVNAFFRVFSSLKKCGNICFRTVTETKNTLRKDQVLPLDWMHAPNSTGALGAAGRTVKCISSGYNSNVNQTWDLKTVVWQSKPPLGTRSGGRISKFRLWQYEESNRDLD